MRSTDYKLQRRFEETGITNPELSIANLRRGRQVDRDVGDFKKVFRN